jgi:hypothetical protein
VGTFNVDRIQDSNGEGGGSCKHSRRQTAIIPKRLLASKERLLHAVGPLNFPSCPKHAYRFILSCLRDHIIRKNQIKLLN